MNDILNKAHEYLQLCQKRMVYDESTHIIGRLVERLEEAVKTLEWYGDMENYHPEVHECSFAENENGYHEYSAMDEDIGELARTTLKRIKGENDNG